MERALKLDPGNVTLMAQKQELLGESVTNTKEKLERLKDVQTQVEQQFKSGEIGGEQYRAFQRELVQTEAELKKVEQQSEQTGEEIKGAGDKAKESGEDASEGASKWGKFGDALGKIAKVATAAAAAALVKLGKEAVSAYADYEQLVGGVETLFGEKSAETVKKNAEEAFKTAGMSANQYMETVTGFSASIIQSLGGDTEKAAEYADKAIKDMSDNANKMGSDMAYIENAYQGFAKQNYTMLDNLKLGYGGTKEEMQRLLDDAGKLAGVKFDLSSYSDIIEAIHVIQTEMGIAGTTAEEAEKTISGSISMAKASFENLLAGLGNANADIEKLASDVISSVELVVQNVAPIIKTFIEAVPGLVEQVLTAVIEALPDLILGIADTISSFAPKMAEVGVNLLVALAANLPEILLSLLVAVAKIWESINKAIDTWHEKMAEAGKKLFAKLYDKGSEIVQSAKDFVKKLMDDMIQAVGDKFHEFVEAGKNIVSGIWEGIQSGWNWLTDKVSSLADDLLSAAKNALGIHSPSTKFRDEVGKMMAAGIGVGFDLELPKTFSGVKRRIQTEEKKLSRSVVNNSSTINNSTSVGGISVHIHGNVGSVEAARAMGESAGEKLARELRYKGVLSLA